MKDNKLSNSFIKDNYRTLLDKNFQKYSTEKNNQ